jgi:hypothetical protein
VKFLLITKLNEERLNMGSKRTASDHKKELTGVCGLFCPSCIVFIAQRETPEIQKGIADKFNISVEMLKCDGCRGENRFIYCEQKCEMAPCATDKGLDFCVECEEYPCEIIKTFQAEMPHRLELWASQDRIKEVGHDKWFDEMMEHYSCEECGTVNSAYHPICRDCGTEPSCKYVEKHKEEIKEHPYNKEC